MTFCFGCILEFSPGPVSRVRVSSVASGRDLFLNGQSKFSRLRETATVDPNDGG